MNIIYILIFYSFHFFSKRNGGEEKVFESERKGRRNSTTNFNQASKSDESLQNETTNYSTLLKNYQLLEEKLLKLINENNELKEKENVEKQFTILRKEHLQLDEAFKSLLNQKFFFIFILFFCFPNKNKN